MRRLFGTKQQTTQDSIQKSIEELSINNNKTNEIKKIEESIKKIEESIRKLGGQTAQLTSLALLINKLSSEIKKFDGQAVPTSLASPINKLLPHQDLYKFLQQKLTEFTKNKAKIDIALWCSMVDNEILTDEHKNHIKTLVKTCNQDEISEFIKSLSEINSKNNKGTYVSLNKIETLNEAIAKSKIEVQIDTALANAGTKENPQINSIYDDLNKIIDQYITSYNSLPLIKRTNKLIELNKIWETKRKQLTNVSNLEQVNIDILETKLASTILTAQQNYEWDLAELNLQQEQQEQLEQDDVSFKNELDMISTEDTNNKLKEYERFYHIIMSDSISSEKIMLWLEMKNKYLTLLNSQEPQQSKDGINDFQQRIASIIQFMTKFSEIYNNYQKFKHENQNPENPKNPKNPKNPAIIIRDFLKIKEEFMKNNDIISSKLYKNINLIVKEITKIIATLNVEGPNKKLQDHLNKSTKNLTVESTIELINQNYNFLQKNTGYFIKATQKTNNIKSKIYAYGNNHYISATQEMNIIKELFTGCDQYLKTCDNRINDINIKLTQLEHLSKLDDPDLKTQVTEAYKKLNDNLSAMENYIKKINQDPAFSHKSCCFFEKPSFIDNVSKSLQDIRKSKARILLISQSAPVLLDNQEINVSLDNKTTIFQQVNGEQLLQNNANPQQSSSSLISPNTDVTNNIKNNNIDAQSNLMAQNISNKYISVSPSVACGQPVLSAISSTQAFFAPNQQLIQQEVILNKQQLPQETKQSQQPINQQSSLVSNNINSPLYTAEKGNRKRRSHSLTASPIKPASSVSFINNVNVRNSISGGQSRVNSQQMFQQLESKPNNTSSFKQQLNATYNSISAEVAKPNYQEILEKCTEASNNKAETIRNFEQIGEREHKLEGKYSITKNLIQNNSIRKILRASENELPHGEDKTMTYAILAAHDLMDNIKNPKTINLRAGNSDAAEKTARYIAFNLHKILLEKGFTNVPIKINGDQVDFTRILELFALGQTTAKLNELFTTADQKLYLISQTELFACERAIS